MRVRYVKNCFMLFFLFCWNVLWCFFLFGCWFGCINMQVVVCYGKCSVECYNYVFDLDQGYQGFVIGFDVDCVVFVVFVYG